MIPIRELGLMPYGECLTVMEQCHLHEVQSEESPGTILVVEHPPTVTMGYRERLEDMIVPPEQLKFKGVAFHRIDRGGSVTVHEPGQIVIYPILHMSRKNLSVRSYVCALEEAMIQTCAHFGVEAFRDSLNPGVWVNTAQGLSKIGAVGIRILNKVTKHGLAFNVNNSLSTFSHIIPCGLRTAGVTTLNQCVSSQTSVAPSFDEVKTILAQKVQFLLSSVELSC
jgi:lipoyl(octanoyl) transferase